MNKNEDKQKALAALAEALKYTRVGSVITSIEVSDSGDAALVYHKSGDGTIKARSEERRVGKECRSRWSPYH